MSLPKNHGSLPSGMKICGWRLSISYSAVVPLLACPTMKKSGTLCRRPSRAAAGSLDAVIAPETDEIAFEVLAEGHDLGLEAPAQLPREALVRGRRIDIHQAPLGGRKGISAQPAGRHGLHGPLGRPRSRAVSHRDGVEQTVQSL